jgi:hypothetical protein
MKIQGRRRLALVCALSISCGIVSGAVAAGRDARASATFSLLANIENAGRPIYSDRYRVSISGDTYVMCAETVDARERMCSEGGVHIGRHKVDLFERSFTHFTEGVPVGKGLSTARRKFEIIFQSNESVVIYSPLEGVFVLEKVT